MSLPHVWRSNNFLIDPFLSQGRRIKCSTSQAKHRLFIGNVPRNWEEEDMKKVLMDVGPGVISVELLKVHYHFSDFQSFIFMMIVLVVT